MKNNEWVQHPSRPLAPAKAVLNSQHIIVSISMIPKDHKYNNTEVKPIIDLNKCICNHIEIISLENCIPCTKVTYYITRISFHRYFNICYNYNKKISVLLVKCMPHARHYIYSSIQSKLNQITHQLNDYTFASAINFHQFCLVCNCWNQVLCK
jgi:hypothetical protein